MSMKRSGLGLCLMMGLISAAGAKEDKARKKSEAVNLFMGNYGYVLEYPASHTAMPSFEDAEKTMEKVLIYPKGTPESQMREKDYAKHGIMRVEVAPIMARTPQGNFRAGLKELATIIPEALKRNGEKCVVSKFEAPFPAAKLTISGGISLVQVILEGAKVTYIFTAAKDDSALRKLIKSLKEIAPTDKPGL